MKPLKEATYDKHKKAEKLLFNVKMIKGELNKEQYSNYLLSQLSIFSTIEDNFELPHEGLRRKEAITKDLKELGVNDLSDVDKYTLTYTEYLSGLTQEDINPHIYLNYMGIMFGGQMLKEMVPGPGNMYEFDDIMGSLGSIRAIQKDEWADEVNKGFDYIIDIFQELEKQL